MSKTSAGAGVGFSGGEKAMTETAQAAAMPRAWAMLAAASRFGTPSLR